jgi:rRNA maturation RNase YbeY
VRVPPGASVDVSAERPFGRLRAPIRRLAVAALGLLDEGACELSIALVGDEEIRRLNASYRGKDATTDVLAFSQREGPDMAASGALLGDVVISIPTAERQAHARRTPLERELAELLVHGILHLLGFDHERSRADARRMFARQREIVAGLERRGWRHPSGSRKLVDRGDETRTRPRGMPSR